LYQYVEIHAPECRGRTSSHSLDADWRLVRLWWWRRQLGLLSDDEP
jgi:hypothetical protein